jgi:deoxyhypusine monooxygenase
MSYYAEKLNKIGDMLVNPSMPIKAKYRACFTLKNIGGPDAVTNLIKGLKSPSVLLKHECCYLLGQLQEPSAIDTLIKVINDTKEDVMVRHEAGEALGAIGKNIEKVTSVLKKYYNDSTIRPELRDTCELSLARIEWVEKTNNGQNEKLSKNPYFSIDPAPPHTSTDVPFLRTLLLDETKPLFERYRAMFQLRNIRTDESIQALCDSLKCPKSSLFRHEVAFVLGQAQFPMSVKYMTVNLENLNEIHIVRHECAEAMGAIGTPEAEKVLNKYLHDKEDVVRESCEVALDIKDYEKNGTEFQYANALASV